MGGSKSCNFFCQDDCRKGYAKSGILCAKRCPAGDTSAGLLCRKACREGYKDIAGVCWFDKCPAGHRKSGARCYEPCPYNHKEVGCCLCRAKCRSGYREVLGVCWKGWKSYVPKTVTRRSDGKLASYVPKTSTKHSYVPTYNLGLYPKILLYFILSMVVMGGVIKLGSFLGVIKSFTINTSQITAAITKPVSSILRKVRGDSSRG